MNQQKTRREVTVNLTEDETAVYANELSRKISEQQTLTDRKKEIAAEYKGKIDQCVNRTRELALKISTGHEQREVDCEWVTLWDSGYHTLRRLDTGEEVERAEITTAERQQNLFDQKPEPEDEEQKSLEAVQQCFTDKPFCDGDLIPNQVPTESVNDETPLLVDSEELQEGGFTEVKACIMAEAGMDAPCMSCGHCEQAEEPFPGSEDMEGMRERLDAEEPVSDEPPLRSEHACPFCDFDVNNADYLRRHLRKTHDKIIVKGQVVDFACQDCAAHKHRKACGPDCTKGKK
jgi:hypothetical protein